MTNFLNFISHYASLMDDYFVCLLQSQLPPGFTIPPGTILVKTETGQLQLIHTGAANPAFIAQGRGVAGATQYRYLPVSNLPGNPENLSALVRDRSTNRYSSTYWPVCPFIVFNSEEKLFLGTPEKNCSKYMYFKFCLSTFSRKCEGQTHSCRAFVGVVSF